MNETEIKIYPMNCLLCLVKKNSLNILLNNCHFTKYLTNLF